MGILRTKIFDLFPSAFGLDLSDLSVKVVQMEESGKILKVRSFGSEKIAPASISDGEILNKKF